MTEALSRPLHVLVVDDKPFVHAMTRHILDQAGVQIIGHGSNGHEAVRYLAGARPRVDLVLCDLMMPDMDGIEVLRHVAALEERPAFIFMSGSNVALLSTAADTARARGISVLGAVEKPIGLEAMRALLAKFQAPAPAAPRDDQPLAPVTAADLRHAIAQDQIVLHYQPKVNLQTRRIEGFETLARWRHPHHGLIPPGQFIALAEESGVIEPLTDRVLHLALQQCAAWNAIGMATRLSINISAYLLVDLTMPDRIAREAAAQHVDPAQIVLEITETGVFRDAADTLDILARLHMKGFDLSIDDFGTGYSSMEQLRRVPFAELKIDRAFVNGAAQNAKARAILQSSATLGRNLGITVVAEGAETQEDWDMLNALGVDVAQGYFVARPMPAEAVIDWSKNWLAKSGG